MKSYLPIFNGFYNSIWDVDYNMINDYIKECREEKGLYSDVDIEINFDYSQYEHDIAVLLCDNIKDKLSDYILNIKFENIYSPKTYNFNNDSINCIIDPNIENIKAFIYSHKEDFENYLKEKYTSCDGFISHYNNSFENWEIDTKNFTDFSINEHYLGSILDFIANILDIKEFDLYYDVIENINIFSYVTNLEDMINYTDNTLYELFTSNGFSREIADYYVNCYENNILDTICLNEKTLSIIEEYNNRIK